MAATWPEKRRVIGTKVSRLDGPEKATGRAKYSFDINLPGMLHARMLRSPYAHAKVKSIDTSAAEAMPGVKAVHVIAQPGKELYYAGDEILAIAADTEEHARDAVRAAKVDLEVLDFLVKEEDALKQPDKLTVSSPRPVKPGEQRPGNVTLGGKFERGKVDEALKAPNAVAIEGTYGVPTICHQCLESHGLVAKWEGDNLTVWCSTQATSGTAGELARTFKIPATQVKCITHYMGGGFGSKFGPDVQGIAAATLARKAGAPVKLMLDREEEIISAGNRPSAYGTVRMAADNAGKVLAYEVDCYGTPGVGRSSTVNLGLLPYVYDTGEAVPNVSRKHQVVRLNAGSARAMRAPGHPQNCVLTDGPLDDLAAKLGLDPMQVRITNLPQNDPNAVKNSPTSFPALRGTIYGDEIKKAAELSEWANKWHPAGKKAVSGPVMHGIGMALHTWGGAGRGPNDMTVTVSRDGSVLIESSTQDLGTGERTVLAVVAAEIFGLQPKDVTVRIGESPYGRSGGSGGSTTCPGTAPAILNAASSARDALFEKLASRLGAKKESLVCEDGKITDKDGGKSWDWKEACAKLGMDTIQAKGDWSPGLSNVGVGGMQVAEVLVDTETGVVRCTKVVAVQDCGLVVSKLTCESQVAGGVIMGVNYALFEERIMDRHTGRQVNPNMEFYKLGGLEDMPQVVVHLHDMPERGVIGIGEPPTISTCAAVGNAVFNAIGVRVPYAPYTPERVLEALAKKGGKS
jgi:xanthine dehydrogenase YagR molybdenum-binding subunit